MRPTFSVLMTCHNYARFLPEAIDSVRSQTDPDWELIVVDDASSDGSWEVLEAVDDPRVTVIEHETNRGSSTAFNTAYQASSGDLICNLDADDRYRPDFLARQRSFLESHPHISVSGTWVGQIDEQSRPVPDGEYVEWFNGHWDLDDPSNWIWQNRLCHNSTVVRRQAHAVVGGLDPSLYNSPDWDRWWRLLATGHRFAVIPEVLVDARVHGKNITTTSPGRRVTEWATISRRTIHPYLDSVDRPDLIAANVEGLFERPELAAGSADFLAEVLRELTGGQSESFVWLGLGIRAFVTGRQQTATDLQRHLDAYALHVQELLNERASLYRSLDSLRTREAALTAELENTRSAVPNRLAERLARVIRRP